MWVDSGRPRTILVNPRASRPPTPPPGGPPPRFSASPSPLAEPLARDAAKRHLHPRIGGHDAKDVLVLLVAGPVDHLHEGQLVDLQAGTLDFERAPSGGLEHAALPAPVRG